MMRKGRYGHSRKKYFGEDHWTHKSPEKLHRRHSKEFLIALGSMPGKVKDLAAQHLVKPATVAHARKIVKKSRLLAQAQPPK